MIKRILHFLTAEEGNHLYHYADKLLSHTPLKKFESNDSLSWDRTIFTEFLMLKKQPRIAEFYDRTLLPNYSSIKIYRPGTSVKKHNSPIKHDVTVLINLFDESKWPTHFGRPDSEETMVDTLNQNEAFIFDGITLTTWRDSFKGPKPYLECQLHYVCNCASCLHEAYYNLLQHPLTSVLYPKLKEGLVSKIDNQPYEHLRAELDLAWKKHATANKLNKELQARLIETEQKLKRYES